MFGFDDFPDVTDIISWKLIVVVVLFSVLRQYLKGAQFHGAENAKQKIIVVTGATSGIGKQIVRELNLRGGKVYMGCRNDEGARAALQHLVTMGCSADRLVEIPLDLSNFDSVNRFAAEIHKRESKIDILINNAGMMMYPKFRLTDDKHELQWQVNYLGHFMLTELLLPLLKAANPKEARIVNVSCRAHSAALLNIERDLLENGLDEKSNYEPRESFSRSKLALVMHAKYLGQLLSKDGSNVIINSCHPGIAYTRHFRYTPAQSVSFLKFTLAPLFWFMFRTPRDGAQTPLYCALSDKVHSSGKYYRECNLANPGEQVNDEKACQALYEYSLRAVGMAK